jgi:5'-3' exonuclease
MRTKSDFSKEKKINKCSQKMGVPRLFPWLTKNFPKAVRKIQEGEETFSVDHLYLDANGILHKYAQLVFHYGDGKRKMNVYRDLSLEAKQRKVYSMFFDGIMNVAEIVNPRKTLYIAIDGPAPRAKQNQQRERRFVAAKDRAERMEGSKGETFDSNSITPGTMFMHKLTQFMNYAIRSNLNSRPSLRNVKIIFSPPTVPGEGEHKIMDYIRELTEEEKNTESHCLFGPDGDLIMLTLAAHIPKMFLFREDQYNHGYYHYVDMGRIRVELNSILGQNEGYKSKLRSLDDITNDFIVEGFFVGNDFLPKIQMFHLLEEGLELMLKSYAHTSKNGRENFLTVDGHIHLPGFRQFLKHISKNEEKFLIDQATTRNPRKTPPEPKYRNQTLLAAITQSQKGEYSIDMQKYREGYYAKVFGHSEGNAEGEGDYVFDSPQFKSELKKMCRSYLRSFVWVCEYYIAGLPSWGWAYEYHYAPLMCDFDNYIQSLDVRDMPEIVDFNVGKASLPFEQLLSVLPPASATLLPKAYRKLMLSPNSPLVEKGYYPETFPIDYEGKLQEFQGVAILPFVDYSVIHESYEKMAHSLHKAGAKKYVRNGRGEMAMFTYDKNYTANYTSAAGDISNFHVRRRIL